MADAALCSDKFEGLGRMGAIIRCAATCVLPLRLLASAVAAEPLAVFCDCDVRPKMVELPLGAFTMGVAAEGEFRRNLTFDDQTQVPAKPDNPTIEADEGPQNRVIVDLPIPMGRNELTHDEWIACVVDGGCGGQAPDTLIRGAGSTEQVMRALTNPCFTHVSPKDNSARAVGGDWSMTVGGWYSVLRALLHKSRGIPCVTPWC